ncbi:hypothetical protein ACI8AC_15305 [Geodermatophilus sp. SYSU D00758]
MSVRVDADEYVVRPQDGMLKVGRRVGGDVAWLDEVDPGTLTEAARTALDRGDADDDALRTALRGLAQAEVERGG